MHTHVHTIHNMLYEYVEAKLTCGTINRSLRTDFVGNQNTGEILLKTNLRDDRYIYMYMEN